MTLERSKLRSFDQLSGVLLSTVILGPTRLIWVKNFTFVLYSLWQVASCAPIPVLFQVTGRLCDGWTNKDFYGFAGLDFYMREAISHPVWWLQLWGPLLREILEYSPFNSQCEGTIK